MSDNTVVMASDANYVWGCWLLIASMRRYAMKESVIVLGYDYSDADAACLEQFPNVRVERHDGRTNRNMTCSKPDAMLLADTEYITWVDCDSMFTGNCSKYLTADPEHIHIRMRAVKENSMVFLGRYDDGEEHANIPQSVLEIWCRDVGENDAPVISTCASACFLSVHRDYRWFLEKWRDQMHKVLPDDDVGVIDQRSVAYLQTDESVLNSLLCFAENAPEPTVNYMLDKDPAAYFVHFAFLPKPWQMWNSYTIKHFDKTIGTVDWALAQNYVFPGGKLPLSLNSNFRRLNHRLAPLGKHVNRLKKIFCKLGINR